MLIVLTKTFDTAAATAGVPTPSTPDGVAVSLQNGLGNDTAVAGAVGECASLVGVTTVGATLQEPGTISVSASTAAGDSLTPRRRHGRRRPPSIGRRRGRGPDRGRPAASHVPDIAVPVWGKLALAVMSPVSSVLRMTVGRVWSTPDGRALVEQMFDEVVAVAGRPRGRARPATQAWAHASRVFAGTGEHYTSMCTDVLKGRPTELAAMAGAVLDLATCAGIPVPVHATVLSMLRAQGVVGA